MEEGEEALDLAGVSHAAGRRRHGLKGDVIEREGGGSGVDNVAGKVEVPALNVTIMQWGKSVAYTGPGRPASA